MWDEILLFIAVGFVAQLVDGAIGMAYGITSTTVLLTFGVSPAVASASVHAAEVFTTAASGLFHWRFGNIDWRLLARLTLPGMVGGAVGAWILTEIPGDAVRPYVTAYLLVMGAWILFKALGRRAPGRDDAPPPRGVPALGLAGGFFDAIGGGGWGPMVTSTLIGVGAKPCFAIGTSNLAEFFVTATITGAFVVTIGLELWPIIAGLIVGGLLAAPIGAYVASRVPDRPMMIVVACAIMTLSGYGLYQALGL